MSGGISGYGFEILHPTAAEAAIVDDEPSWSGHPLHVLAALLAAASLTVAPQPVWANDEIVTPPPSVIVEETDALSWLAPRPIPTTVIPFPGASGDESVPSTIDEDGWRPVPQHHETVPRVIWADDDLPVAAAPTLGVDEDAWPPPLPRAVDAAPYVIWADDDLPVAIVPTLGVDEEPWLPRPPLEWPYVAPFLQQDDDWVPQPIPLGVDEDYCLGTWWPQPERWIPANPMLDWTDIVPSAAPGFTSVLVGDIVPGPVSTTWVTTQTGPSAVGWTQTLLGGGSWTRTLVGG